MPVEEMEIDAHGAMAGGDTPSMNNAMIMEKMKKFVKGCSHEAQVSNEELAETALLLLKTLPATRQAVLEHLCNVFDEGVNNHLLQIELKGNMANPSELSLEPVILSVQEALMAFVKNNSTAWSPIISEWCIELLGQISSKYADRRGVPNASYLNDLLQLWMSCLPTKVLIGIASECFSFMVDGGTDCCEALLKASVKYSPHLDWVVAHIGSCFPTTIVHRVLTIGLRDFHAQGPSQQSSAGRDSPTMESVVSIMGHLGARHGACIRTALMELFKEAVDGGGDNKKLAAIPFLLHLMSMSPVLLKTVTTDFVQALTPEAINSLTEHFLKAGSSFNYQNLVGQVIHLLCRSGDGSLLLLQLLMRTASPDDVESLHPAAMDTAAHVLDLLLIDLQRQVHKARDKFPREGLLDIPLLQSLQGHLPILSEMLLTANETRRNWMTSLMGSLCIQGNEECAADILCSIVQNATDQIQLNTYTMVSARAEMKHSQIHKVTSLKVLSQLQSWENKVLPLTNLILLIQWQRKNEKSKFTMLSSTLQEQLYSISSLLLHPDPQVSGLVMELCLALEVPSSLDMTTLNHLVTTVVKYFFNSLNFTEFVQKRDAFQGSQQYLVALASMSVTAQKMVLTNLVRGSLFDHAGTVGGQTIVEKDTILKAEGDATNIKKHNRDTRPSNWATHSHVSISKGGMLVPSKPPPKPLISKDEQKENIQLLMENVWMCCRVTPTSSEDKDTNKASSLGVDTSQFMLPSNVTHYVSLLMVEYATPDVMYNGILWPEEESIKFTVERDLLISKKFDEHPILWSYLDLLCDGAGAVAYSSVLIRANTAVLLAFWDGCRDKVAKNCPIQLEKTCKVVDLLRKGKLLPPPLCHVGEILSFIHPHQVYLLLLSIWKYMKENPPVPDPAVQETKVSSKCNPMYTEALQSVLLMNISQLGKYYARFHNPPKSVVVDVNYLSD